MSAPAKRVQFFLKEDVLAHVEQLGEEYDKSLSAICGQLVKEALATRGLIDYEVPSQADKAKAQELLGSEPWCRRMKAAQMAREAEQTAVPSVETTSQTTTSIQKQKLKLMNELMEQLKSL